MLNLPELNLVRPKVALNRWRRWMRHTPFVGDVKQAGYVACAISNCDRGRNDKDADLYRKNVIAEVQKFKSTYSGEWGG